MTVWRAAQYDDLTGYLQSLTPVLRHERTRNGRAAIELQLAHGAFIPAKPAIVTAEIKGNQATCNRIMVRQVIGASRTYTTSFPQAFTFARSNRSWGLADDGYVEQKAKEVCAACISGGVAKLGRRQSQRKARMIVFTMDPSRFTMELCVAPGGLRRFSRSYTWDGAGEHGEVRPSLRWINRDET